MIRRALLFIPIILSLHLSILGYAQNDAPQTERQEEYVISPNNILEITVYGEPDLSTSVRVSPTGTISYPLLGNIKAAGLTVKQLEKDITDSLGEDYLVTPQVSIFVKEYSKISILGEVRSPGAYEMKENLTLTQAVALAGGFTDEANTAGVKIIRTVNNKKDTIEVDVDLILDKSAPDVDIRPDDTIIIDEYGRISIIGQVGRPGVYNLKRDLTVVEAIGLAGGFTATAAQNATRVVRVENGKKKTINIPVADITKGGSSSRDILLEPGDTIVVPESFF